MRILLIIFMFFFVMPIDKAAAQGVQHTCKQYMMFQSKWRSCRHNGDCQIDYNPCGMPIAANKRFEKEIDIHAQCLGPVISCVRPEPLDINKKAICLNRMCSLSY